MEETVTAKKRQTQQRIKHYAFSKATHEKKRRQHRQEKRAVPESAFKPGAQARIAPQVWGDYAAKRMGLID